jgi:hypothetical protein
LVGALVLAPALALPQGAQAASNGEFSVFPARESENLAPRLYFFLSPSAGQTVRDSVTVTNFSEDEQTLDLYAGAAENAEVGGALGVAAPEEEPRGVAEWITLSEDSVTLEPGESQDVPFTLTVPRGAPPGDSAGAIVAYKFVSPTTEGGAVIRQRVAVGARMYVRVEGPLNEEFFVEQVQLNQVEPRTFPFVGETGTATLVYRVTNVGNVRITPKGSLTLKGLGGRTLVGPIPLDVPEVLPDESIVLTVPGIEGIPSLDRVVAEVTVETPDSVAKGSTATWVASPAAIAFLVVLLVAVLAALAWFFRRLRRKNQVEEEPEDILEEPALT